METNDCCIHLSPNFSRIKKSETDDSNDIRQEVDISLDKRLKPRNAIDYYIHSEVSGMRRLEKIAF